MENLDKYTLLIDEINQKENELKELVNKVLAHRGISYNWVWAGWTDLQKGLMCLNRAVTKPDSF